MLIKIHTSVLQIHGFVFLSIYLFDALFKLNVLVFICISITDVTIISSWLFILIIPITPALTFTYVSSFGSRKKNI